MVADSQQSKEGKLNESTIKSTWHDLQSLHQYGE